MFDIRKIQEKVIYESVKAESNADLANEVVYGKEQATNTESNSEWVKSAMHRLESRFESDTIKKIRRNCQCGYGMDEKAALVKELKASVSSIEEFANSEKAKAAGLSCRDGELFLQFHFCPCPMLAEVISWRRIPGVSVRQGTARSSLSRRLPVRLTWNC